MKRRATGLDRIGTGLGTYLERIGDMPQFLPELGYVILPSSPDPVPPAWVSRLGDAEIPADLSAQRVGDLRVARQSGGCLPGCPTRNDAALPGSARTHAAEGG